MKDGIYSTHSPRRSTNMPWAKTVIVRRFISLVVTVQPQAIPDRVGGRTQNPTRFCSAANHPTRKALRGDLRCRNQRSTNWGWGRFIYNGATKMSQKEKSEPRGFRPMELSGLTKRD